MMYEFELTEEEYWDIVYALRHARDEAIHDTAKAQFNTTNMEIREQYHNQEGSKITDE